MDVTFLVGNGFDLSLKLRCEYPQFYKWYETVPSPTDEIEKMKKRIRDDINNNGGQLWSDFEYGLGQVTKLYTKDTIKEFILFYEDALKNLAKYLAEQEEVYDTDAVTENDILSFRKSIYGFYSQMPPLQRREIEDIFSNHIQEVWRYNIISFNYTRILDNCIQKAKRRSDPQHHPNYQQVLGAMIHIHGYTNEWPILGVGDKNQVANQELFDVYEQIEYLVKSQAITALGEDWIEKAKRLIDKSAIVCIYGMSLGATDCDCWQMILQWLKGSEKRKLVILWYEMETMGRVLPTNRIAMTKTVQDLFLSYSNFSDEIKEKLRSQIFISEPGQFLKINVPKKATVIVS